LIIDPSVASSIANPHLIKPGSKAIITNLLTGFLTSSRISFGSSYTILPTSINGLVALEAVTFRSLAVIGSSYITTTLGYDSFAFRLTGAFLGAFTLVTTSGVV
jgi:hypothetical protein